MPATPAPKIPTREESYGMPMTALRKCHPHLYTDKTNYERKTLAWEKLWSTTSNEYGNFIALRKRMHANQQRNDLWRRTGWDTTGDEIGAGRVANSPMPQSPLKSPPKSPLRYSRHSTASTANVLKVDHDKPQSPLKVQKAGTPPQGRYPLMRQHVPLSHPKPHALPPLYSRSQDTFDINNIDRTRPNLTSGYAKKYVRNTQGPFWNNMESQSMISFT